jgi:hypothetical protein
MEIRRCLIFLPPVKNLMLTRAYSCDLTLNSFGKAAMHERNWLLTKKHMAHWIESWNYIKHWRILYENDTKRRIQLCVKIKTKCYADILHVPTRKHNFFFRPNHILTVELRRIFNIFFFFQEKTLGDISFKLETKIMSFMSVFF